jgi:hypothetical protein
MAQYYGWISCARDINERIILRRILTDFSFQNIKPVEMGYEPLQ